MLHFCKLKEIQYHSHTDRNMLSVSVLLHIRALVNYVSIHFHYAVTVPQSNSFLGFI